MKKQQLAALSLALWLIVFSFVMVLLQWSDLELFFAVWFIGLLIVVSFIEPHYIRLKYQNNMNYLIAAGVVIFGIIFLLKIIEILTK